MYKNIKYILDVFIAFIGFIIISPILVIISLIIKFTSHGPILFKQKRVGKNKKLFTIYKFRTMKINAPQDTPTHMLEDPNKYITVVGKFLRKTSLDELPQIFNILMGQMSIVGPRPALWNQDDLIEEREKYNVNSLKPGLTGLAQVNGRDAIAIPDKAKLDGEYARKISFLLDVKIFFKTIRKVLNRTQIIEGKGE